jgi:uncharacterized protein (TIGR00369 family)
MTSPFAELWPQLTGVEMLVAIAAGRVPNAPHAVDIGLALAAASPGRVELVWRPPARLANPAGIVHGGYLAMALDDAAGLSCVSLGDRFRPMLTLELRIDYLHAAAPDAEYRALGEVVHAGKTRVLADARVLRPDGQLLARASGTFVPNRKFDPSRDARAH